MMLHRTRPLPEGPSRGRLIITQSVEITTGTALRKFRGPDCRHEGLVYWAGRRDGSDTLILAVLQPSCDHGPQRVMAPATEIGRIARAAREMGLAVLAQVHSHPGDDTRHSDGDDDLVLMPFEGMYSLVVGRYGDGSIRPEEGCGMHQFQEGRWVRVWPHVAGVLIVVPPALGASV